MQSKKHYIRPSHALCFDECAYAYYLKYVLRVKPSVVSANLPFGTAVHVACTDYIMAEAKGDTSYNPVDRFNSIWEKSLETEALDFSSTWSKDDLSATGVSLVEQFPDVWGLTGLVPLIDEYGPVVERKLSFQIAPNIILTGTPDLVAMNDEGVVIPLDLKTSAQEYNSTFLINSEQLTDYQILVEGNSASLGLDDDGVGKVGFFEGVKRKIPQRKDSKGPQFLPPKTIEKRSEERKLERIQKLIWMAEDIDRGRFVKRPRMAYNSPCDLCEFSGFCATGSRVGLKFPED